MELIHYAAMRRFITDPFNLCGEPGGRKSSNHRLVTCPKCVKTDAWQHFHERARTDKACNCRRLKKGLHVSR